MPAISASGRTRIVLIPTALLVFFGCGEDPVVPPTPVVSRVEVVLSQHELTFGESTGVSATVYDQHDEVMSGVSVAWSSSDSNVAQISGDVVTATGVGDAILTARAGDAQDSASVTVSPAVHALTPAEEVVGAYRFLRIRLGADVPHPAADLEVEIDGEPLWLTLEDDSLLVGVVPDVGDGSWQAQVWLTDNDIGEFSFQTTAAPVVEDSQVLISGLTEEVSRSVDAIMNDPHSDAAALENARIAQEFLSEFEEIAATLSEADLGRVAQYLAANRELFERPTSAELLRSRHISDADMERISRELDEKSGSTNALVKALGGWLVSTFGTPADWKKAVLALKNANASAWLTELREDFSNLLDFPFIPSFDQLEESGPSESEIWGPPSGTSSLAAAASDAAAEFTNGVDRPLELSRGYRTIEASDTDSPHATIAALAEAAEDFRTDWPALVDVIGSVIDFFDFQDDLAGGPPGFHTPPDSETRPVPPGDLAYLGIDGDGIECEFTAGEPLQLKCDSAEELPQEFSVRFRQAFWFGADTVSLPAVLLPMEAFSQIVSGDGQSGYPGDPLNEAVRVSVLALPDSTPLEGALVHWSVTSGGGSVASDSSVTGADGHASTEWTLGDPEGEQTLEAAAAEGGRPAGSPVVFTAVADRGAMLQMLSGDGQSGSPDETLPDPLVVRVADRMAQPVEGSTVEWTVIAGDGALSRSSTTTGSDGQTSVDWTLGSETEGAVEAAVFDANGDHIEGSPVTFVGSTSVFAPTGSLIWVGEDNGIYSVPGDGSTPPVLLHAEPPASVVSEIPTNLAWSPDGSHYAYSIRAEGIQDGDGGDLYDRGVFVGRAEGGTPWLVLPGEFIEWSPSGQLAVARLRYTEDDDGSREGANSIWLVDRDGANATEFMRLSPDYYPFSLGAYSPDGGLTFLAGSSHPTESNTNVDSIHVFVGSTPVLSAHGVDGPSVQSLVWSPSGRTVLITMKEDFTLYTLAYDVASGSFTTLIEDGGYPRYSPDGSLIAYLSSNQSHTYVIPAGGGSARLVGNYRMVIDWDGGAILVHARTMDQPEMRWYSPEGDELLAIDVDLTWYARDYHREP